MLLYVISEAGRLLAWESCPLFGDMIAVRMTLRRVREVKI